MRLRLWLLVNWWGRPKLSSKQMSAVVALWNENFAGSAALWALLQGIRINLHSPILFQPVLIIQKSGIYTSCSVTRAIPVPLRKVLEEAARKGYVNLSQEIIHRLAQSLTETERKRMEEIKSEDPEAEG